jgi:OPA family glycerol-3-phosphate transporter-like MFS transporter/OPA family sugar phosphate sensor protein UhpC-like MFS transporter
MLAAGWITDNIFGGRGARTCLFYMAACTAAVFALWKLPLHSGLVAAGLMSLAGFFIYGPQALVGIAVANLATKHAAATAVGLTGLFGYLSGIVSGWGIGKLADLYGWDRAFEGICAFSLFGTILFALAWFAPAHGYTKSRA